MLRIFAASLIGLILSQSALAEQAEEEKPKAENPIVVMETNRGTIKIELFAEEAPITVENFLAYVNEGFYDGTIFHRVIPNFVIQGGGFTKELQKKKTKDPIKNEAKPELKNLRGTLSMARTSAPDSATSQFFINLVDNKSLDYRQFNVGYAVFGQVTEGIFIVDGIASTRTGTVGIYRDVPVDAIEITKAYQVKAVAPMEAPAEETQQEAPAQAAQPAS